MIRAIIRPECEERTVKALEQIGIYAMTKIPVTGRGRQGGVQAGGMKIQLISYDVILDDLNKNTLRIAKFV